jgi:superfamily II DNA or RNA helicase
MESELPHLSAKLLASADRGLLDMQLDFLSKRMADDEVRELLAALHEAGEGDRLRDVLERDRLAHWASSHCTAREEEALCQQLRKWLGMGDAGGDDPARLVSIEPVPEDPAGLFSWAEKYHVERLLGRPAHEVLPASSNVLLSASLADVCIGQRGDSARGASLLSRHRAADEARSYLRGQVAATASLEARAALHREPLPAGPLGQLARRLRAVFAGHELPELCRLRFVPARPVRVEVDTGVCGGALLATNGQAPIQLTLYLSGYEQRALEGRCEACRAARCVHQGALAARLFDACLLPTDRLHEPLSKFVGLPSWQRFLQAVAPAGERAPSRREQLSFALRLERARVSVGVLHRRVQADGRLSQGKLVSAHKLVRSPLTTDRDQAALAALIARTRTTAPQYVPADLTVLRALVEHPEVQREGSDVPLRVVEESLHVALLEQPEGLRLQVSLAGAELWAGPRERDVNYVLHWDEPACKLTFSALTPALLRLLSALEHFRGVLPPESYPQLAPWLSSLRQSAQVSTPKALDGLERPPPERLLLRITPRLDEGIDLSLTVRALPLAPLWSPGQGPELVHGLLDGTPCSVRRDLERERALSASVVAALGLDQLMSLGPYAYRVDTTQAALSFLAAAARLTEVIDIEWAERARALRIAGTVRSADLKVGLFKRGDWCALAGGAQQGALRIAVERLLEAARTGERFVPITPEAEGGDYLEIEQALFERLAAAQLCLLPHGKTLALPAAAVRAWFDKLGDETEAGDAPSAAWLALARADVARGAAPARTAPLEVTLRSYQEEGVAWLLSRSRWAQGVCLADEMGLGKTVQTIALLAERAALGPALVVAPTSVVDGWLSELARFAPKLDARLYRGAKRKLSLTSLSAGSVLVTSYDTLLRDLAELAQLSLATLVIDEAQLVKNARTRRAAAVGSLDAQFRVALSGTPIENRLGDLWSLFHLVTPGLLGSWARFRARFAVPIERYENAERATALRALVAPFLLRRTKREVERELPPRTDVVHLVALSQAEQDLYDTALAHARRAIGKRKQDDGARTVQILAELTRLRQLACHPRLVLGDARVGSSKLAALTQLLRDLLPRGHRVLIFSQFVRHLALVREAVEQLGASYLELTGSTPASERAARVDRFQRGEAQLFLISLKAGGTGLNLTAADYVVHMDPWWNPSVEDQASDRAHRIGQQQPVTVLKLVAQGTIEERVLGLHEHKRRLSQLVIADDGAAQTTLDLDALETLLGA